MAGLSVDRRIAAAPERVWRAFTEPRELSEWFWPPAFATDASLVAEVGGAFRAYSAPVGLGVSGVVTQAVAGRRLALTWRWDAKQKETAAVLLFAPDGDGTRLTVRHDGFSTDEMVADHVRGWSDCLDRLIIHLTS